jgi:hypothetical protein
MIKNLKKVISSAAAVAMLASSASAFALTFPDVDESASYANAVSTLTGLGIVNGDDNGKFNPDNSVTRAEFAKMVVEALGDGDAAAASTYTSFSDCQGHWAAGYIQTGVAKEFINGYDENTFGPDDTVTYAQAVKMLVGACGYDLWASNRGGWPSGYLSYGSSLKITNGVSMGNDVAVTRAQCAVLIYNALQAPLLAVNGYEYDNNGNLQPKYDQMDGEDKDWQTMLTEYHDAYVVKGRVMKTSKSDSAVDKGMVTFRVESSDRFKDETVKKNDTSYPEEDMYVGETNAEDLLFTYSEAIVQVDDDTDDITIISITPYGTSKSYEFAADDVVTKADDSKNGKDPWTDGQIAVKKSSTSSSTTKYDLEAAAELYVNGQFMSKYTDSSFESDFTTYVVNNSVGTVTIIDATETGSTSTNGKYDYIMVTYYVDAVVDDVSSTSAKARINLSDSTIGSLSWDPEDEDMNVKFIMDDEEVSYEDLQKDDVLSIAFTPATVNKVENASSVTVYVARDNIVSGTVSRVNDDTDENYAVIDDVEYKGNADLEVKSDWVGNDYTFYLNAFDRIVKFEEGETSKNYGVVVGMYKTAGSDYYTVRLITADGEIKPYECKNETEQNAFIQLATDAGVSVATGESTLFSKNNVGKEKAPKMAVSYKLSGDKIRFGEALGLGELKGGDLTFKESSGKLGSYQIVENTMKIVDLSSYFSSTNATVGTLSLSSFGDDENYTAYVYSKNTAGDYRFMIVLDGTTSLRANAPLAVVKKSRSSAKVNDQDVYSVPVALISNAGDETTEETTVYYEDDITLKEGDVIAYNVGAEGYAETDNLKVIFSAESSYADLYEAVITDNAADFDAAIESDVIDLTNNYSKLSNQASAKKVTKYFFGPITYKNGNSLEIATKATSGKTDISKDIVSFSLNSDTKVYTYDFTNSKDYRVEVGGVPSVSSSFFDKCKENDESDVLVWSKVVDMEGSKNPSFALVKEYDDDVTEVVVFLADDVAL